VTKRSQDGGIDGHGDFRQGAISIRPAFQAKRWTGNAVGRPEIDKFRGATQGDYDHGVFLTTSRFSRDAKLASYRKGAISVLLLDGPAIAEMFVERGLGVRRLPLYVYDPNQSSSIWAMSSPSYCGVAQTCVLCMSVNRSTCGA